MSYNENVKYYQWDPEKDLKLKKERKVSFEQVILHVEQGDVLDILEHKNQEKYQGQKVMVIRMGDYAYLVPFVEDEKTIILKTVIPSRKATKLYLRG